MLFIFSRRDIHLRKCQVLALLESGKDAIIDVPDELLDAYIGVGVQPSQITLRSETTKSIFTFAGWV